MVPGEPSTEDTPKARDRAADTVAAATYVLQNRDRLVREALRALQATGLLDTPTADRIWMFYEASDTRTRMMLQQLVARVVRVPLDRFDLAEDAETGDAEDAEDSTDDATGAPFTIDTSRISKKDLDRLKTLSLPQIDPQVLGDRIRFMDIDRFFHDRVEDDEVSFPVRLAGDIPMIGYKLKSRLRSAGVVLLVLSAAALAFPQYAQQILFYGLIGLLVLLAAYLIRLSIKVDQAFQRYEIDVDAMAKLNASERR